MFLRRIYYNTNNGNIIFKHGYLKGYKSYPTKEHDFLIYASFFKNIDQNLIGCLEWFEPDPKIEEKINSDKYTYTVDITTTPHQLKFTEIENNIPEQ